MKTPALLLAGSLFANTALLVDEAKTKLTATLGQRGFEAYRQSPGARWINRLTPKN
jgi:hypothetical protein